MSRDRPRRPVPAREDRELWEAVTREVKPLARKIPPAGERSDGQADPPALKPKRKPAAGSSSPAYRPPPPPAPPAGPVSLEPRLMRRLSREPERIDAVIDLHGLRQDEAHSRLDRFVRDAAARGFRLVMVITGKGRSSGGGIGVLRRAVPQWLAAPALAPLVVGFAPAHRHRGGEGAIYVQLRRRERLPR